LTALQIFVATGVLGTATAFESPATAALLPLIVPPGALQRATALSSGSAQIATITGPALGGLAYAVAPGTAYGTMVVFWLSGAILTGAIRLAQLAVVSSICLRCCWAARRRCCRSMRDILQTGPWGLGILRAAPAVGALVMTAVLARHAINRRVGVRIFQAVIVFGVATVVFALSQWMWLSVLALAILGAADIVSVVIRFSLVQLATPDEMRGRVGAVNFLFINASNQLGQFESGVTAALFGAVPAAVLGGLGTIAIALLWMKLFPTLRDVERLE
jgi:MFS family permease